MKVITVLLADDHALVRRGFRRLLEDQADIKVVGEASDGREAIQLTRALSPHVVLMDYNMPGMNGLLATREIVNTCPETAVLVVSMHREEVWMRQAATAGARGFVLKNAMDLDLGSAVKRVATGELVFDEQIISRASATRERVCELSARELEVLQLIVDGRSNKEIANQLNVSTNTVGTHRANIMRQLGVHKTAELIVYAIQKGLVNIP